MLVVSRKMREGINIVPGESFAYDLAVKLLEAGLIDDVSEAAREIEKLQADPLFQIYVCIVQIGSSKVRVGVQAENAWSVRRDEVAAA